MRFGGRAVIFEGENSMRKRITAVAALFGAFTLLFALAGCDLGDLLDSGTNSYTITYRPGTYGVGAVQTQTKSDGENVSLYGSGHFTRDGYTQTGWSTTDGSAQTYALSELYTANASITLYPV